MAVSSISATLPLLPLCNSSFSSNSKLKSPLFSFFPTNHEMTQTLRSPTFRISSNSRLFRAFAAPELLDSEDVADPVLGTLGGPDSTSFEVGESEAPGLSPLSISEDVDTMAPKQKIRIKLKSYYVPLIEDSAKQIMDAARTTNAKTVGPVPLPTKKRIYCVLKSPHVHKDARFHFEIRTHQRLIDIFYPTAETIDALMQLDLPAGVDVQVKL